LKQRGCATRELYGNRRVDSRKRDKEQMCPFDTGTELCSTGVGEDVKSPYNLGEGPEDPEEHLPKFEAPRSFASGEEPSSADAISTRVTRLCQAAAHA